MSRLVASSGSNEKTRSLRQGGGSGSGRPNVGVSAAASAVFLLGATVGVGMALAAAFAAGGTASMERNATTSSAFAAKATPSSDGVSAFMIERTALITVLYMGSIACTPPGMRNVRTPFSRALASVIVPSP